MSRKYVQPTLTEIKPIPGYGGDYLLTPGGDVISFKRKRPHKLAIQEFKKWIRYRTYHREKYVGLCRGGVQKNYSIRYWLHRLYPTLWPEDQDLESLKRECYAPLQTFWHKMEHKRERERQQQQE